MSTLEIKSPRPEAAGSIADRLSAYASSGGVMDDEYRALLRRAARLVRVVPELKSALILMVRTHDEPAESLLQEVREQQWLEKARAAIAKTDGEQA